jgi:hypothetical protein
MYSMYGHILNIYTIIDVLVHTLHSVRYVLHHEIHMWE